MFLNNVFVTTATAGTGTITLGSVFSANFTTEEDKAVDGKAYCYVIRQGSDFEEGIGVYTASGRTLTRVLVQRSRISGTIGTTKLTLAGAATVALTPLAEYLPPAGLEDGGRLTLTSGSPVTTSDVTAATAIYLTPMRHDRYGLYDGVAWRTLQLAEMTLTLDSNTAHSGYHAMSAAFDVFLAYNSGTPVIGTGPMWALAATVTMTIASPGVVTATAHGRGVFTPVILSTTGALPTGLVAGTTYYVVNPATDTFQLAATPGGAAINTSGSQSGTHTARMGGAFGTSISRGTGAGSTELEWFEGRRVNKYAMTIRNGSNTYAIGAREGHWRGSFLTSADGQTEDSTRKRYLSNAYNAEWRMLRGIEAGTTWGYDTGAYRLMNNNGNNTVNFFSGWPGRRLRLDAAMRRTLSGSAGVTGCGIGVDALTANVTGAVQGVCNLVGEVNLSAHYDDYAPLGFHYASPLELGSATTTWASYGAQGLIGGLWN